MGAARFVLIALLAIGCSGLSSPPARVPAITPAVEGADFSGGSCNLVTDAEVGGIMQHQLMAPGSGFALGGISYCNWAVSASPLSAAGITVSRAADHDAQKFAPFEPVAGLGDDAYWMPGLLLSVRSGTKRLTVVVTSDTLDTKSAAIAIARLALSRLA